MAREGLIRNFSDEKKSELEETIQAMGNENGAIFDFIRNNEKWINGLLGFVIVNNLTEIENFYNQVTGKKVASVDQLKAIFNNVNEVDINYKSNFSSLKDKISELKNSVDVLANVFDTSKLLSGGEFSLAMSNFSIDGNTDKLIDHYYAKLRDGKDGEEYNWDYIKELMNSNPSNISESEYAALCKIMDDLSKDDIEKMEKFINGAYINPEDLNTSSIDGLTEYTCSLSPVFVNMYARYSINNSGKLNDYLAKNNGIIGEGEQGDDIKRIISNISIMSTVCSNFKIGYKNQDEAGNVSIEPIYLRKESSSGANKYDYNLGVGKLGVLEDSSSEYRIKTYNNGNQIENMLNKEAVNYIAVTTDDGVLNMAVGLATVALGFSPYSAVVYGTAAFCTYQAVTSPANAQNEEERILSIQEINEQGSAIEAFQLNGAVTVNEGKVTINYGSINQSELEFLLVLYGEDKLSVEDCTKFLFEADGSKKEVVEDYCNWYYNDGSTLLNEIKEKYISIYINNSDELSEKEFSKLSLEEKKYVYEKYKEIKNEK